MTDVVAFRGREGGRHFTCTDCGETVRVFMLPDDAPVCLTCRFLERECTPAARAAIRAHMKQLREKQGW